MVLDQVVKKKKKWYLNTTFTYLPFVTSEVEKNSLHTFQTHLDTLFLELSAHLLVPTGAWRG